MAPRRPSRATLSARLDAATQQLRAAQAEGRTAVEDPRRVLHGIHHSTALAGNRLTLREVEELLERGRAVGGKLLREYAEVTGYADADRWVREQPASGAGVSSHDVRHLHRLAMTPVHDVSPHGSVGRPAQDDAPPGELRRTDVRTLPGGALPPPWRELPALLARWGEDGAALAERARGGGPAVSELVPELARSHAALCAAHPFPDGNGRVARLALGLALVRLGLPPVVLYRRQRPSYLAALRSADAGDAGPLGELLARAMLDAIARAVPPDAGGGEVRRAARLVPLASLADEDFSGSALRHAAARGRLDAVRRPDGTWRSSRSAVQRYKRTRYRRRSSAA